MSSVLCHHIEKINNIFKKSVDSVLKKLICPQNGITLHEATGIGRKLLNIKGQQFDVTNKQLFVIGFGKAVLPMAVQLEKYFPKINGILSIPHGAQEQFINNPFMKLRHDTCIQVIEGAEGNYPDAKALHAARLIEQTAASFTKDTIVFVLVSGGGSALLPNPKLPFTLPEKMELIHTLSNHGASINEMNIVRIALSKIKGGRLSALLCKNAHSVISFIISDIVRNPVELIASGPTVPLPATVNRDQPKDILKKYNLWDTLTQEKKTVLLEPLPTAENLKLYNNYFFIVGNNQMAVDTALSTAYVENYAPCVITLTLEGEVTEIVKKYLKLLNLIKSFCRREISAEQFNTEFPFDKTNVCSLVERVLENSKKSSLLILADEPTVKVSR